MAHEVIAFDMALDHPCPDVWRILEAPDWYPRFFRGLGSCEQISAARSSYRSGCRRPLGTAVVRGMVPRPVEEAIAVLPQVSEVAVVGVPDPSRATSETV